MTPPETTADRYLRLLRNNRVIAATLIGGAIIVGTAGLITAVQTIAHTVAPRRPAITNILVARSPSTTQYEVLVSNPTDLPIAVNHVRLSLGARDSAKVVGAVSCGVAIGFYVADSVRLDSSGRLRGLVSREGESGGFAVPTYGRLSDECGGGYRSLDMEFDSSVPLMPHAATTLFIRMPRVLRVEPVDSFGDRLQASIRRNPALARSSQFFSGRDLQYRSLVPRGLRVPAVVEVDSALTPGSASWDRKVTVTLLTSDGRYLSRTNVVQ